jgi:hypothetical protein
MRQVNPIAGLSIARLLFGMIAEQDGVDLLVEAMDSIISCVWSDRRHHRGPSRRLNSKRLARAWLERFPAKWTPVRVEKTRQIKNLEPRSDSIGTETALVSQFEYFFMSVQKLCRRVVRGEFVVNSLLAE